MKFAPKKVGGRPTPPTLPLSYNPVLDPECVTLETVPIFGPLNMAGMDTYLLMIYRPKGSWSVLNSAIFAQVCNFTHFL